MYSYGMIRSSNISHMPKEKEWRPPNWKHTIGKYSVNYPQLFEDGADAMIKAVKEKLGKMAFLLDDELTSDQVGSMKLAGEI